MSAKPRKATPKPSESIATVPPTPRAWPDPLFGYVTPTMVKNQLVEIVKCAAYARDELLMVAADIEHDAAQNVLLALGSLKEIGDGADDLLGRVESRAAKAYAASLAAEAGTVAT